jgi:hypothetical protein
MYTGAGAFKAHYAFGISHLLPRLLSYPYEHGTNLHAVSAFVALKQVSSQTKKTEPSEYRQKSSSWTEVPAPSSQNKEG